MKNLILRILSKKIINGEEFFYDNFLESKRPDFSNITSNPKKESEKQSIFSINDNHLYPIKDVQKFLNKLKYKPLYKILYN